MIRWASTSTGTAGASSGQNAGNRPQIEYAPIAAATPRRSSSVAHGPIRTPRRTNRPVTDPPPTAPVIIGGRRRGRNGPPCAPGRCVPVAPGGGRDACHDLHLGLVARPVDQHHAGAERAPRRAGAPPPSPWPARRRPARRAARRAGCRRAPGAWWANSPSSGRMNAASGPAAAPRSSSSARVPSMPTLVGPVVTSSSAVSRLHSWSCRSDGAVCELLVLRDARGDVRRLARAWRAAARREPSATAASSSSGTGFSPWARRWSRRSASQVPTSPTTLPASWSPPGTRSAHSGAPLSLASHSQVRVSSSGGVRVSSVPCARKTGMPRELSPGHRDARVERQRAIEEHAARPAVRLGEHQRARDRHALAEAPSRTRAARGRPRCRATEEPRSRADARLAGSGRPSVVAVPEEPGVARDRPADGDVGDGPVRQPRRDLDHGVLAGAVAVEGDDERRRRVRRAPAGDHRTVVRRHGPDVDRRVHRRVAVCQNATHGVSRCGTRLSGVRLLSGT